ncbi:NEW3 domain-containing protein [Neorhizobium sp. S3-V5DH]|uniref:NEW3 domain-containing protein n=1 Tax=Neorhizobium sp. S3-V5DH TaxID=2485166 RepID=UPI00104EDB7F|nr:NEW3 domain-containing protein [Neorhizobium sp. S3-V5DH]TCV68683.1 alpha-galactosidase-like protein [Neorhizobium sp. S3-V5DH]
MTRSAMFLTASALTLLIAATPALAQETRPAEPAGFWLTTPYPELSLGAGKTENIPLTLRNSNLPPQRAQIEVSGIPAGWKWALKGGAREVSAAIVAPNESEKLTLEITPPADATGTAVPIEIRARHDDELTTLPLTVRLAEAKASGVTLDPELPALKGGPRSTFSYKIRVKNEGAEDALLNLSATVPDGFRTRFKQGYGSEEITGVPVQAGSTADVTMEVLPTRSASAGRYPIAFQAASGAMSASTDLSLEITGEPQISIVGPQERLSGEAVAGKTSNFTFTVANNGSAPAEGLELSSTPPSGWKVAFEPEQVDVLAPNSTREINVSITPSERAVTGDYMVSLRANGSGISESVQFRTTVRASTLWGMAGLGVIAVAIGVLGTAVTRYGRR